MRNLLNMSRIGKQPIPITSGVTVSIEGDLIKVKGSKGEDVLKIHPHVTITDTDGALTVAVKHPEDKQDRALWGLYRALIANMVQGVSQGFEKKLEMVGVGYKANVQGNKIVLEVGFSHPVEIELLEGVVCTVEKNTITIAGFNKQAVGELAARIRAVRKPEPYKGKGIKYIDEVIRRKAGKAAKTGEGAV